MRRIPGKLLPHRDLVKVHAYEGGGAGGRVHGTPVTVERALIVDDAELIRDQYDAEAIITALVYFERSAIADLPEPETKVTIWAGTADERKASVVKCARYHHPRIADLLEVRLR